MEKYKAYTQTLSLVTGSISCYMEGAILFVNFVDTVPANDI